MSLTNDMLDDGKVEVEVTGLAAGETYTFKLTQATKTVIATTSGVAETVKATGTFEIDLDDLDIQAAFEAKLDDETGDAAWQKALEDAGYTLTVTQAGTAPSDEKSVLVIPAGVFAG